MERDFTKEAKRMLEVLEVRGVNGEPANQIVVDYVKHALERAYYQGRFEGMRELRLDLMEGTPC